MLQTQLRYNPPKWYGSEIIPIASEYEFHGFAFSGALSNVCEVHEGIAVFKICLSSEKVLSLRGLARFHEKGPHFAIARMAEFFLTNQICTSNTKRLRSSDALHAGQHSFDCPNDPHGLY